MNPLNVLIVGGGVQGLWLLNELHRQGYSALLVTDGRLGGGQTLHSHVYLHRGHLYTEIAMARRLGEVNRLWDAFLKTRPEVQIGENPYFILPFPAAVLWQALWKAGGLPPGEPAAMPEIFNEGIFSPGAAIRTPERWIDGERLVHALSAPVLSSIRRGLVLKLDIVSRKVKVDFGAEVVLLEPEFIVLAAGAGNQSLLHLAARDARLSDEASGAQRLRQSMMLVLRGTSLPKISCIVPDFPLFMVPRVDGEKTVWLGSYGVDELVESPPTDGTDPPPPARRVSKTVRMIESLIPSIPSLDLEWGVYTGLKSERVKETTGRGVPSEEAIETFGVGNFAAVWPTKLTLAPLASATILEIIRRAGLTPAGSFDASAAGLPDRRPLFGSEKWRGVDWMNFSGFRSKYGA